MIRCETEGFHAPGQVVGEVRGGGSHARRRTRHVPESLRPSKRPRTAVSFHWTNQIGVPLDRVTTSQELKLVGGRPVRPLNAPSHDPTGSCEPSEPKEEVRVATNRSTLDDE